MLRSEHFTEQIPLEELTPAHSSISCDIFVQMKVFKQLVGREILFEQPVNEYR